MRKLISNSIIKLTVFSFLTFAVGPTVAGLVRSTENHSGEGTGPVLTMINDFERFEEQGHPKRSGAFTFSSDRRSVVECGGVYKRLQSEIRSPGFPDGYQGNLHCEYTFKSPFVCSSQYHFQFVEFALEPSRNCSKDRVAIGHEEVLCGTVIGSKLYDAPGGVLRMKFVTDGWGTGRGFRILVTRQPCTEDNETAESSTAYTVFTTIQVADETVESSAEDITTTEVPMVVSGNTRFVSSRQDIPPEFNPGGNGYLPPPTNVSPTYPPVTYPPSRYPTPSFPCPAPCYPPWGCQPSNYPTPPPQGIPCDPRYQSCVNPGYPDRHPGYPDRHPGYPSYPQYPQQPAPMPAPYWPSQCPTSPCVPGQGESPSYPQYPPNYYPGYPTTSGTEGTTSLGGAPPGFEPVKSEPRPEFPEPTTERGSPESVEPENQVAFVPGQPRSTCCRNAFGQRRFYLSSAHFPSQNTVQQDCLVQVQRFSPQTCRLVISFKFFLLGNEQLPGCPGGFVEIDGRRICGCRTGLVYRTADFGPYPTKTIRVHSQPGRFPTVHGFVLDVYQEECQQRVPLKRSDTERLVQSVPAGRFGFEMGRVEGRLLPGPVQSVQTTNTTRTTTHQVYYYNLDDAQPVAPAQDAPVVAWERQVQQPSPQPAGPNRCIFTVADWLRLKLDWLWIFKPVCV